MRILIIGGTRFIGPHVIEKLVALGHEVTLFHRGQTKLSVPAVVREIRGDRHRLAEQLPAFRRLAPDVVLDMIAFTEKEALELVQTFRGIAGRIVIISSGDVYRAYGIFTGLEQGPVEAVPLTEDSPLRKVLFPYRATSKPGDLLHDYEKILVERTVLSEPTLPATILRLPMVYGPGDYQHRLSPYLRRMMDGRNIIVLDESLAHWRCLRGFVEDVAAAIALVTTDTRAVGRVYNVAEADAHSEAEWVARVGGAVGWEGKIVTVPRGRLPVPFNTDQDLIVDSSRIRAEMGYRETIATKEALEQTVAWERQNFPDQLLDYTTEDKVILEMGL